MWPLTIHRIHIISYNHDKLQNVMCSLFLNAGQCWLCLNLWHLISLLLFLLSSTTLDGFWLAQVFLANIFCQNHTFSKSSTPTIFRSPHKLSHHLPVGLPFGVFNNVGIQLVIFLVIRCSILCICLNHPSLLAFIRRTIFSFLIILSNSSLFHNLHDASGLLTGP
jgi:hypothetical protein